MVQQFWTIIGIVASLFLGAVSNWLFEVLRGKVFPAQDRPTLKWVLIIVVFAATMTGFIVLSQRFAQANPAPVNRDSESLQATSVALVQAQLEISRQIATAQSGIATAQAEQSTGLSATAQTGRLIELIGTQQALAT